MTPNEKQKLEIEIYLEIQNNHGSISSAADFLRHKDSSRISRLVNPNDSRANNIFGEFVDVLQGFYYKHPKLVRFIWEKINLAVNSFMGISEDQIEIAEIKQASFKATTEQFDVDFALSMGKPLHEVEAEAFQALEHSKRQYELIVKHRAKSIVQHDYTQRHEIDYKN